MGTQICFDKIVSEYPVLQQRNFCGKFCLADKFSSRNGYNNQELLENLIFNLTEFEKKLVHDLMKNISSLGILYFQKGERNVEGVRTNYSEASKYNSFVKENFSAGELKRINLNVANKSIIKMGIHPHLKQFDSDGVIVSLSIAIEHCSLIGADIYEIADKYKSISYNGDLLKTLLED